MRALHRNLLYDTEVRWLSKGKVMTRDMELGDGDCSEFISYPELLLRLAFLYDVFEYLNNLNKRVQRWDGNVITAKNSMAF